MIKKILILCAVFLFIAVIIIYFYLFFPVPDFSLDRLYKKELEDSNIKLKWFFYSSSYTETPDYITIESDNQIDTICIANNIANLQIKNDTIIIDFYGQPKVYNNNIIIPSKILNYNIKITTDCVIDTFDKVSNGVRIITE
jgi:hypothetical protein